MKGLVAVFFAALLIVGCSSNASDPVDTSGSLQESNKGASVQGSENKAVVVNDQVFSFGWYNECCEEFVSGFQSGLGTAVMTKHGIKYTITSLTAQGESGRQYTMRGASTLNFVGHENGGMQTTRVTMIGDDGCSFIVIIHVKVQYDANGNPRVEIFDFETECI